MDIQPDKQNLDQTFSTTVYYIDFYQRDYRGYFKLGKKQSATVRCYFKKPKNPDF